MANHVQQGGENGRFGEKAAPELPIAMVLHAKSDLALANADFRSIGFEPCFVHTLEAAQEHCEHTPPAIILAPVRLGLFSMIPHLEKLRNAVGCPVVVIAENDQINEAADAMRAGVDDCLFRPFSLQRLARTLRAVRGTTSPPPPAASAEACPKPHQPYTFHRAIDREETLAATQELRRLVGTASELSSIYGALDNVAQAHSPVLIHGEFGAGKTPLARAIHVLGQERTGNFVVVNCGALDAASLRDTLTPEAPGNAFHRAAGGTLYLHQIEDLDRDLQRRLLPLVTEPDQEIRIIASLCMAPPRALSREKLRPDLYHALNVSRFNLPPLRRHPSDILPLVRERLERLSADLGRDVPELEAQASDALAAYGWPGNLVELEATVRGCLLTCGERLTFDHLPADMKPGQEAPQSLAIPADPSSAIAALVGRTLADIERAVIEATIAAQNGSVTRAARILDLAPSTLYRKRDSWTDD